MKRIMFIFMFVICMAIPFSAYSKERIVLTVTERIADMYYNFVEEKGGDPLSISDFESPWSIRAVVDIVIIQQALHRGGMDVEIDLLYVPNPARGILEVKNGQADMFAHDVWKDDFDDSVFCSSPIIRIGEFEKVVFTKSNHGDLLSVLSLEELNRFIPVVSQSWSKDIGALETMGFSNIFLATEYSAIFRIINSRRGDFTLLSISELTDGKVTSEGISLIPVQGVKVIFPFSRHFMVSRRRESGQAVYDALEKGIAQMREEGIIFRAMVECGFIEADISDWIILNPIVPES